MRNSRLQWHVAWTLAQLADDQECSLEVNISTIEQFVPLASVWLLKNAGDEKNGISAHSNIFCTDWSTRRNFGDSI